MGKLYEAIRKEHEFLLKQQELQEQDYLNYTRFKNIYDANKAIKILNFVSTEINKNKEYYFKSENKFKEFFKKYPDIFANGTMLLPTEGLGKGATINVKDTDYEKMFDAIETEIGSRLTTELIAKFEKYDPELALKETHPFDEITNNLINDVDTLNLDINEAEEIKDSLKYFNDEIIEKHGDDDIDHIIDGISIARDLEAHKKIKDYANSVGIDGEKLNSMKEKGNIDSVVFIPRNNEQRDFLMPFLDEKPTYSDEFKQKILELDNLITSKGIIKEAVAGETGNKEYGFLDYFDKANEVKRLVINQTKLVDEKDKIANLNQIKQATKELKEVANSYDEVMDFIKDNFDLTKINVPANVYSGRLHEFNKNNPEKFLPNLPKRWDFENAPYGVILNSYAQLKGCAKVAGVSIEEYMNDPVKSYIKGAKKVFDKEDQKFLLPNTPENSLGKRIANILIMDDAAYKGPLVGYDRYFRGVDFLNECYENEGESINNIIKCAAAKNLYTAFNHEASTLFGDKNFNIDYDSLKKLFALGNSTDNLFEVATNYYDENLKESALSKTYDTKISNMQNVSPLNETRRVMQTIRDYMVERNRLYAERRHDDSTEFELDDKVGPAELFVGAKEYMNDFIYKNNINLLNLDKDARKEVFAFLEDPVKAFAEKYGNQPNILLTDDNGQKLESFGAIQNNFKGEFARLHENEGKAFVATFNDLNNKTNGANANKTIAQILDANKGGYWERKWGSTSKEYKALVSSVEASTNPESPTFGDLRAAKVYAQKYIDHKLPINGDFEKLSENEKRRVEFCQTVIGAASKLEFMKNNPDANNSIYAKDNEEFQEDLKDLTADDIEKQHQIIQNENEIVNENVIKND